MSVFLKHEAAKANDYGKGNFAKENAPHAPHVQIAARATLNLSTSARAFHICFYSDPEEKREIQLRALFVCFFCRI